jgi:hypothetical protein
LSNRWHGKDGRWGERVKVDIPVQLSQGAVARIDGCMTNLSLSGALMKADVDLRLHSLIEVTIVMPSPQAAEAITAHVSRKIKEGLCVEWCECAPRIVKDLLRSPSIPLPD